MLFIYAVTHRWNGHYKLPKLTFKVVSSEQLSIHQPYIKCMAISFPLSVCFHSYLGCIYSGELKYVILTLFEDIWYSIGSMVHP